MNAKVPNRNRTANTILCSPIGENIASAASITLSSGSGNPNACRLVVILPDELGTIIDEIANASAMMNSDAISIQNMNAVARSNNKR